MNDMKTVYYHDKERKQIWAVGADWCWPSRTYIYTEDGEYLDYDDSYDSCAEWCERLDCDTLAEAVELIRFKTGVDNKDIMFIYDEIDNVYENIEVLFENIEIAEIEENEADAQKYNNALNQVYCEIGKAVLEQKNIAKRVQKLLRGENYKDDRNVEEDNDNQILCALIVHEEAYEEDAEWYIVDSTETPRKHALVQFNYLECGYVLETKYMSKEDTISFWTIGGDSENGWGITTKPAGVLCAKVETYAHYGYEEEWFVIHENAMHKPQIDERVDISRYDKGVVIETSWFYREHAEDFRQLSFDPKYNSWYIEEKEIKIENNSPTIDEDYGDIPFA